MAVEPDWHLHAPDPAKIDHLTTAIGCPAPVAAVLANKGITEPEVAEEFLGPSASAIHRPDALPNIESVTARLTDAVAGEEVIGVVADRDVDGLAGAAILTHLLTDLGGSVSYHIPGKWDGYGLNQDVIDAVIETGAGVLVTVDCGTTAQDEIAHAQAAGLDVIVTDHHHPEEELPACLGVVNPRRSDSEYPNPGLSGGAVAWKVGQALTESINPAGVERFHAYGLSLAAVATVGDYMPLTLENRAIVREGYTSGTMTALSTLS